MKAYTRILSLLLAMIMLVGVMPFAAAEETEPHTCSDGDGNGLCDTCGETVCAHAETKVTYQLSDGGSHMAKISCAACGEPIDSATETCVDNDASGRCDLCNGVMVGCRHIEVTYEYDTEEAQLGMHKKLMVCANEECREILAEEEEDCYDTRVDGVFVCDACGDPMPSDSCTHDRHEATGFAKGEKPGTHLATARCSDCKQSLTLGEEECADLDADGKCDTCGYDVPKMDSSFVITCAEHGSATTGTEQTLTFVLEEAADPAEVQWFVKAEGSADPICSEVTQDGLTATVTVGSRTGIGVAAVTATAIWGSNMAEKTFHVSFYDITSKEVILKDGLGAFRFNKTNVFTSVSGVEDDKVKIYSLQKIMTDGAGSNVCLTELRPADNAKVAKITYSSASNPYDPTGYNYYKITNLSNLTFTLVATGEYVLNYEIFEPMGDIKLTTTKGTLRITVGKPAERSNLIIYRTDSEALTFDENDFLEYWATYMDEAKYPLAYVRFAVSDKVPEYGLLYLETSMRGQVEASSSFAPHYEKNLKTFDLNGVTYMPDTRDAEKYTVEIPFTMYSESGKRLNGIVQINVGKTLPFSDVAVSAWYYDDVLYVYDKGIMTGVTETAFQPSATLTRAMVVTMLYRIAGEPGYNTAHTFTDVPAGTWYDTAVCWAAENGIVKGMTDDTFAPNDPITREQLASILYRYTEDLGHVVTTEMEPLSGYEDLALISRYAEDAMTWNVNKGILQGAENKLNPLGQATRAEAAAMFARYLKK